MPKAPCLYHKKLEILDYLSFTKEKKISRRFLACGLIKKICVKD